MRIDLLLYRLRFARSRSRAKALVEAGHVRRSGERIERACSAVQPGDVLTFPLGRSVCVLQVDQLPQRRGPAGEAQQCYHLIEQTHP